MCSVKPVSASPGFWMRELTTRRSSPASPASISTRRSNWPSLRTCSTLIESIAPEHTPAARSGARPAARTPRWRGELKKTLLILSVLADDQVEDGRAVLGIEDLLAKLRAAQKPRDARQRLEVDAGAVFGGEQDEEELRRLALQSPEDDPPPLPRQPAQALFLLFCHRQSTHLTTPHQNTPHLCFLL